MIAVFHIKSLSHIQSIKDETHIYMGLLINKHCATYSDPLIHNIHAFNTNIIMKDTQRQHLTWKPIKEKPQRFSSYGMRNRLAPLVCALNLQTLL